MSSQADLSQRLELRDAAGCILGYFLPTKESGQAVDIARRVAPKGDQEEKSWEQNCKDVTAERDRLRAEIAQLRAERDQYLKSLYALTRKEVTFTEGELLAAETIGLAPDEIFREIEHALAR